MKTAVARLSLVCASLIFISLILTPQSDAKINLKNIVALWLFDEGSGKVVADSSGRGHDGTIENPNWVDGKFGKALEFEGVGGDPNYVVIPHHEDFNFGEGDFTIGLWVDSKNVDSYIMVKRDGGRWWNLNSSIDRPGDFFGFEYNAGANDFLDGTVKIVNTGWHHCAAVRENGVLSLYVDGEFDVSEQVGNIDSETDIDIGGWGSENLIGIVDEAFIANVALTQEDLKTIMEGWEKAMVVSPTGKLATTWGAIKAQ
ncbi:MAG: LamG domain-containing protein [bacterium]